MICLSAPPEQAVITTCGHAACMPCAVQLVERFSGAFNAIPCPMCRHHVVQLMPANDSILIDPRVQSYNHRFGHSRNVRDMLIDAPEAIRRFIRDDSSIRWLSAMRASALCFAESVASAVPDSVIPQLVFTALSIIDDLAMASALSAIVPSPIMRILGRLLHLGEQR